MGGKKKPKTYYATISALPASKRTNTEKTLTRLQRLRLKVRKRVGEAPPPRAPANARRAHQKSTPAGTARGFRPEARRSPFGSGSNPALAREPSRSFNIRDQRLALTCISGDRQEGKDPVTPLPVGFGSRCGSAIWCRVSSRPR